MYRCISEMLQKAMSSINTLKFPGQAEGATVQVGILHSLSGALASRETPLVEAELMAIEEINATGGVLGKIIEPIVADGASDSGEFENLVRKLIQERGVNSIFGCNNSQIRKAVLPIFEELDAQLWYSAQYEGMESAKNIFYTGSCPNQQTEPAVNWLLANGHKKFYLVGTDDLFSHAVHKLIKQQLEQQGFVVGEAYMPPDIEEFQPILGSIKQINPDIIVNTLDETSNLLFYQQYRDLAFAPETFPVMAFRLSEVELKTIGKDAQGTYATWSYFQNLETPRNQEFIDNFQNRYGEGQAINEAIETAYTQVYLWKQAVELAQSFDVERLRVAVYGETFKAPSGLIQLEPNHHVWKPYRIAQVLPKGQFTIIHTAPRPAKPLPWLSLGENIANHSEVVTGLLSEVSLWIQRAKDLQKKSSALESNMAQLQREMAQSQRVSTPLPESEAELQSLFEAMTKLILVINNQGRYLKIAPNHPDLSYQDGSQLLGKTLDEVFDRDQADTFLGYIREALESQETVHFEYCLTIRDEKFWLAGSLSPISTDSVLWVARDISEQKQQEERLKKAKMELEEKIAERTAALKESNDRLVAEVVERTQAEKELRAARDQIQAVLEAVPGIVSRISHDLRYLEVNRHLAEMFELTRNDFVGQDIGFLNSSSEFKEFVRQFFAKKDIQDEHREVSANVQGKERKFLLVAQKYDQNRATFIVGIDITKRHRAEKQLLEAKDQMEAVLEAVPGIVSRISHDLRYLEVNSHLANMFELPRESFVGQDIGFLNSSSEFKEFVRQFFAKKDIQDEHREVSANVQGIEKRLLLVARKYDHNQATFIVGIDITKRHRAEEQLLGAKDQMEAVLEAVPGIVSRISQDLHYLEVNRHLAETFNLPREAFVGQDIGFLNSSSEFNTFVRQFFADNSIQDAFREVSAKVNGIDRKYLIVAQKYDRNRAAFTIGIDITERQQAEERLRQAEAKYRNIFENAVEGIFQTTPEGYFISANPALARIYGYDSPQELITNLGSISDNLYVKPGTREKFVRQLNQCGSIVGFEAQVYRRDGTLTWISENARTVCDEEGNLLFYEGTVEDIAERKEAQEALQRANEQLETRVEERTAALRDSNRQLLIEVNERQKVEAELRALFAAMTDVIAVFDAQGRYLKIVSTNSELLYNPSTERIGRTVYEVLPSPQAKLFVSHIQRALNTGQTVYLEYSLPVTQYDEDTPNQEIWYAANVSPMPDNCAIWVARDITERKQAEKALERAEEKYRSIFENAAEGIFQIDPHGRHISANPALIEMYGYLSLRDLIGGLPNVNEQLYVNRERRQEFLRLLEQNDLVSNFESQIYRKDGSIIWISENTRVVRNEFGKMLYYEGTATDITKRKEAEEALREEQARSERLLLNILPKTIAEQLKHYEGSLAERFDEATVLFADIVEFTPISANVPPLELVSMLNRIFSCFDQLAEELGLEKIKTIGDAYMVAGGLPVPRADHVEAIADMALAMQREIVRFKQENGEQFRLRIGINTGPVVAGVIGIKKFIYDLWGDTVNVASRMESQGAEGEIQVTETTYQRLREDYLFISRGKVNIKGKGKMKTYWLKGKK